jgi:hypothetical protein
MVFCLYLIGKQWPAKHFLWSLLFLALQLYVAIQILLPILRLEPTQRSRVFYLLAATGLALLITLSNSIPANPFWQPLLAIAKSALLILSATAIGTVLARFVTAIRNLIPICIVMSLADISSWLIGPTADFSRQIETFYRKPIGPPPAVDQILIKLAFPGMDRLVPVFGISDWIMVVLFINVANKFSLNDNLLGIAAHQLIRQHRFGLYLPLPALALFSALVLAQTTGFFVPALPFMAATMLLWYGLHSLLARK